MAFNQDPILDDAHPRPRDHQLDAIVAAFQKLSRALQQMSMYTPDHPAVGRAVNHAIESFDTAMADDHSLAITVTQRGLICHDEDIAQAATELQNFASLLHDLDIVAVEFQPGLQADELGAFLQVLAQAHKHKTHGAKFVEALDARETDHIQLHTIDHHALRFADGANQSRDDSPAPEEVLNQMIHRLTDPANPDDQDEIQRAAAHIIGHIRQNEGVGAHALRGKIHQAVKSLPRQSTEHRLAIRRRLASFVAGLDHDIRTNLLRVTTHQAGESLHLISELAADLPIEDVAAALKQVDCPDFQSPQEMLRLVNRLAEMCDTRPDDAAQLHDILERWGIPAALLESDSDSLTDTVNELFHRRTQTDFNPADYTEQLEAASTAAPLAHVSAARYRDPFDPDAVADHAARIASQLLINAIPDSYSASLFAHLDQAADSLLQQGDLTPVHDAVTAATARLQAGSSPETQLAAQGFLNDLKHPARVDAVIMAAGQEDGLAEIAFDLLHQVGGDAIRDALTHRGRQDRFALEQIFSELQQWPSAGAVSILTELLDHELLSVRREALRALWQIDARPERIEPYLRRALDNSDVAIEVVAIARLAQWDSPRALELLGAYIEGELSQKLPALYNGRKAAEALMKRGPVGHDHLYDLLGSFSRSWRRARWAQMLVDVIRSQTDSDDARPHLKCWRFSPARLACALSAIGRHFLRRPPSDRSSE